jgi:hypothetical protein
MLMFLACLAKVPQMSFRTEPKCRSSRIIIDAIEDATIAQSVRDVR